MQDDDHDAKSFEAAENIHMRVKTILQQITILKEILDSILKQFHSLIKIFL